jgi:hypothetical protein
VIGENVTGIMNLATFGTALSLAYAGLDKFDPTRRQFEVARNRATELVSKTFGMNSLEESDVWEAMKFDNSIAYYDWQILGMITGSREKINTKGVMQFLYVQWNLPLFRYFRDGRDLMVMALLSIISSIAFIIASSATAWNIPAVDNAFSAKCLFVLYTAVVVTVFVHLGILYRYASVEARISRLASEFIRGMNERIQKIELPEVREGVGSQ